MLAGGIDHGTGSKDLNRLQGLRTSMPITFILIIIGALSLAGLPPLFGFIGKELLLEASLGADFWVMVTVVLASALVAAVALTLIIKPFFRTSDFTAQNTSRSFASHAGGPLSVTDLSRAIRPAAGHCARRGWFVQQSLRSPVSNSRLH